MLRYVMCQEVDMLYKRAIALFKHESILHVFAAQFYNIYRYIAAAADWGELLRVCEIACISTSV